MLSLWSHISFSLGENYIRLCYIWFNLPFKTYILFFYVETALWNHCVASLFSLFLSWSRMHLHHLQPIQPSGQDFRSEPVAQHRWGTRLSLASVLSGCCTAVTSLKTQMLLLTQMIFVFTRRNTATTVHCPGVEGPVWSTLEAIWKMRDRNVKAISILRDILVNSLKNVETMKSVCLGARKRILISGQPDCTVLSWRRSLIIGSVSIPFSMSLCQCLELSRKTQHPETPVLCWGINTIWPCRGELRHQAALPVHPVLLLYCTIVPKPAGTQTRTSCCRKFQPLSQKVILTFCLTKWEDTDQEGGIAILGRDFLKSFWNLCLLFLQVLKLFLQDEQKFYAEQRETGFV